MAIKKELTKEERINKEIRRLKRIYKDLPKDTLVVVDGLIVQAARHRIDLDDDYEDMKINGKYQMFSQSEKTEPYERERPVVRQYYTTDKLYQTTMKQLTDNIPKKPVETKPQSDGFDEFVMDR
ncbi:TPA: hypothetical protein ACTZ5S_005630 [Bacillus cereus]|uniref:hypothetical protein n=1 Tax=Bacillus cereus TaxID=1396 RepID=UPI002AC1A169|nr:hypothetical protein [Bacillus cereus]MDZ4551194.1 hypothetical protein [Bacillus cereus]